MYLRDTLSDTSAAGSLSRVSMSGASSDRLPAEGQSHFAHPLFISPPDSRSSTSLFARSRGEPVYSKATPAGEIGTAPLSLWGTDLNRTRE